MESRPEVVSRQGISRTFRTPLMALVVFIKRLINALCLVASMMALCASVFAVAGCKLRSVDKGKEIALNEAVVRDVPLFPGARLVDTFAIGDKRGNGWPAEDEPGSGPNTGYRLYKTYELPRGTASRKVLAFYEDALRDTWRQVGYSGDGSFDRSYRKGKANLYISISQDHLYFSIDHRAYA